VLSGATLGYIPLDIIQLLWTNLVMDILGALALGTEPPASDSTTKRISRKEAIILPTMWRNIILMSIYQIIVMVVLMFFGQFMFFEKSFDLYMPLRKEGQPTDRLVLNTILFYTFILMNLFNQFNCRVLEDHKYNILSGIYKSYIFVLVLAFEFFLSWGMTWIGGTSLGSALIGTAPMKWNMHLYCWLQGASVLLIQLIIK